MFILDKKNKICYLIIVIGLVFSIFNSINTTLKFDKFVKRSDGSYSHQIIYSQIKNLWSDAHLFKKDLDENKNYLDSGGELYHDYLYPKLIAFYYKTIGHEIKDEENNIVIKNYKFGIPIIQSIIFFLSLIFFYRKISRKFDNITVIYTIAFLTLEPSLLQYQSSYWSESLYLSLLLIMFCFFIEPPKQYYKYFLLGLLVGFLYMIRNVSILLIVPLSFYFLIVNRKKGIIYSLLMLVGYALILSFIGLNEYKKSGVFYFTPHTQGEAHWIYVADKLNAKKNNISENESNEKRKKDLQNWIDKNQIDLRNLEDKKKVLDYKKNFFIDSLKGNIFEYIKLHVYKSLQYLLIDFNHLNIYYNFDYTVERPWETNSFKKHLNLMIVYSLIIYLICFFGLIRLVTINKEKIKLAFFIILIPFYYYVMLGWTGITRYNAPNLIFLSVYFGFGIRFLYEKFYKLRLIK
tara:strand:- start:320 stop:1705 length:1386 start_codon:yes stop_codon:yes gene_type:complete